MNPDFAEMLSELSAEGVQFLLVGRRADVPGLRR